MRWDDGPTPATSGPNVRLWLDHASVAVPDLDHAVEHLDRRLGLRATVSPEAPERHSRVLLHRSYLEVSKGSRRDWVATLFFLRFSDPVDLRAHLEAAGIEFRFGEYEGVDGTWDDVEVSLGSVPLPILVRRTLPASVASDWPPALREEHRCGARSLAAVHLEVTSLDETTDAYRRLLAIDESSPSVAAPRSGGRSARVPLAAGELALHEGGSPGRLGVVLGVPSLATPRATLGDAIRPPDEDDVAWVDPAEIFGLRLGFTEVSE